MTISERDDTGKMSCPMRQNHAEVEVGGGLNDYIRDRRHWRNVVSNATESCRSGSGGLNDYIRDRRHWRNVVSNATESCRSGSGGGG